MTANRHDGVCEALVDKCKHEAKQLVEFSATCRKLHWTHPSFTSFCVSVEDVLSYGVKRNYRSNKAKPLTPSAKILHDLAKTLPEATSVYGKCYLSLPASVGHSPSSPVRDDYAALQSSSLAERKVLWIRVALIEKKLQLIIDGLMRNPRAFYTEQSVMCHPVYGEIFCYLLDGPCSLAYSRVRTPDLFPLNPSPAEMVRRHQRVLTVSIARTQQEAPIATKRAWSHVHSLYQTPGATTLFGKNSILVQPAGFPKPLQGYLSVQLAETSLSLKWIPNQLLQENTIHMSSLWEHLLNVSIERVAHIHCHRSPTDSAQMILIGYDGIAQPPIIFPHQPSFFHFLECLENGLLPQGSLEPPLWYLKTQTAKRSHRRSPPKPAGAGGRVNGERVRERGEDWWEGVGVWNQVFRVRCGGRRQETVEDSHIVVRAQPPLPLDLASYTLPVGGANGRSMDQLDSSESSEEEEEGKGAESCVAVERHRSLARKDWRRFQSKVSHQLLARYFYSWLSYRRHMSRVREKVSHMVTIVPAAATCPPPPTPSQPLGQEEWQRFLHCEKKGEMWKEILRVVYLGGTQPDLRKEVWPHLLGVFAPDSTPDEREAIKHRSCASYRRRLVEWKAAERKHVAVEERTRAQIESVRQSFLECLVRQEGSGTMEGGHDSRSLSFPISTGEDVGTTGSVGMGSGDSRSSSPTLSVISDVTVGSSGSPDPIVEGGHDHTKSLTAPECNGRIRDRVELPFSGWEGEGELDRPLGGKQHRVVSHDLQREVGVAEMASGELEFSPLEVAFIDELVKIDKDVPRCDRDYWYFKDPTNLQRLRNLISTYVWTHMDVGYSQGMCDLLAPLLVVIDDEPLAYACFLCLMETAQELFPPSKGMNTRLANVQALLQVLEPDFFQYLSDKPMGDGLFYCYRWFLVGFKREFGYPDIFRVWETIWAARLSVSEHFEEFIALAVLQQYKAAMMDGDLDASDILNLFTDLADKRTIDSSTSIALAQQTVADLQAKVMLKDE